MNRLLFSPLAVIMMLVAQVAGDPGTGTNAQVAVEGDLLAALGRQVSRVSPGALRPRVLT